MAVSSISSEYMILGAVGALLLGAFAVLIVSPALSAYGRTWEKFVAGLLTVFVLVALASVGVGIGLAVVYNWDAISELFG